MDLRFYPPFISAQCSFNKMDSTANPAGDISGLIKIGDDREALLARIVAASIIQGNLT